MIVKEFMAGSRNAPFAAEALVNHRGEADHLFEVFAQAIDKAPRFLF